MPQLLSLVEHRFYWLMPQLLTGMDNRTRRNKGFLTRQQYI
ncbi:hypothetical protein DN37_2321 [Vibrio cholerae]|nr:hypothetical protein DN37_2321 [Vibrio cholerae]